MGTVWAPVVQRTHMSRQHCKYYATRGGEWFLHAFGCSLSKRKGNRVIFKARSVEASVGYRMQWLILLASPRSLAVRCVFKATWCLACFMAFSWQSVELGSCCQSIRAFSFCFCITASNWQGIVQYLHPVYAPCCLVSKTLSRPHILTSISIFQTHATTPFAFEATRSKY